jgi:hypothetical protein
MSTVKDLKDYKKELYTSQTRELEAFEKNFILISSGMLAFSVTFIKDIVKIEKSTLLFFMFLGWGLIIVAIALMMWAFLKSANASTELSAHVDDFLANKDKFAPTDTLTADDLKEYKSSSSEIFKKSKKTLKSIRYWAVRTFIAGVASFSFFVSYNLMQEKKHGQSAVDDKCDSCCATITIANLTVQCSNKDTTSSTVGECKSSQKEEPEKSMQD